MDAFAAEEDRTAIARYWNVVSDVFMQLYCI